MPLLLHIETATEVCSVCISKGSVILSTKEAGEAYAHSSQLTLLIESCLQEAQLTLRELDAVALSEGPGSYTALRVGTSTAKGICYALDKPMIAVDTLHAMAIASCEATDTPGTIYAPMIDARRMEVYTALFDGADKRLSPTEAKIIDDVAYATYFAKEQPIVFSGNGSGKCQEVIRSPFARFKDRAMSANHLLPIALRAYEKKQFADLAYFSPEYFKSPNITKSKKIW